MMMIMLVLFIDHIYAWKSLKKKKQLLLKL